MRYSLDGKWIQIGRYWVRLSDGLRLPVIQGAGAANTVQNDRYAFGDDDGTEAGHSLDTENQPRAAQSPDVTFMFRVQVEETAGMADSWTFQLYAQKNGTGGFTGVTAARNDGLNLADDVNSRPDNQITSERLTAGAGSWTIGKYDDGTVEDGMDADITLNSTYTDLEFAIEINSTYAIDTDYWELRVESNAGADLDSYPGTLPKVTADIPQPQTVSLNTLSIESKVEDISISPAAASQVLDSLVLESKAEPLDIPPIILLNTLKLTAERPYPNIADIDFETVDFSEFDGVTDPDNDLSVSQDAAMFANWGMEVLIDDAVECYGTKNFSLAGKTKVSISFRININSLTMGDTDEFTILQVRGTAPTGNFCIFNLRYDTASSYRIRFFAYDDAESATASGYYSISDAAHTIEIHGVRATGEFDNNGTLELFIDEVSQEQITGLDNYDLLPAIDKIRIGATGGIDYPSTNGTFYLDKISISDGASLAVVPSLTTVSPGAVSSVLDTLILESSADELDVVTIGALSVALDTLLLESQIKDLNVSPAAVSTLLDTLLLTSSLENAAIQSGAATIALDNLILESSAESLFVSPSAASVAMNTLILESETELLSILPGAVSQSLDSLILYASAGILDVIPKVYYVDATGGSDSNDGYSTGTAWQTIGKVNGEAFSPNDSILFNRGETWEGTGLIIPSSGVSGSAIIFGAYGNGNNPIINRVDSIPGWGVSGSWTDLGGDVWSFSLAIHPWRLWLSDTEYSQAQTSGTVDSDTRWAYDAGADILYVYATSNPSGFYSDIEGAQTDESSQRTILIRAKDYITIQDIDIRGSQYAITVSGASGISILGCDIGRNSKIGIVSSWYSVTSDDSLDGEIANCTIESGFNFVYDWESTCVGDAINLNDGSTGWIVHDNVISNWGHTCVMVVGDDGSHPTANILIYDNEISSPNTSYCRAFEARGDNSLSGVEFYRNDCHDLTVRCQIVGPGIEVYNNLFYDFTNTPAVGGPKRGQAIMVMEDTFAATDCKIYHNTFANIASNGIAVMANTTDVKDNLIRNNIFYNCGNDDATYPDIALRVENEILVNTNTLENNIC